MVLAVRAVVTFAAAAFAGVTESVPLNVPTVFGGVKRTITLQVLFVATFAVKHVDRVVLGGSE